MVAGSDNIVRTFTNERGTFQAPIRRGGGRVSEIKGTLVAEYQRGLQRATTRPTVCMPLPY